jgi:hypothetical protein
MRSLAILGSACVAAALAAAASGAPPGAPCSLWASPTGSDTNSGTRAAPLLTLTKLASMLEPGQTGCLPAGATFANREVVTAVGARGRRITITTAPGGKRAILADGIETTQATRYLTLTNLAIRARDDSPDRNVSGTVMVRGYSVAFTRSYVGPGTLKNVGRSCVWLDHARAARIDGNVLHSCNGDSPGLYSAGVLASISVGAKIENNVIFGNVAGSGIAFSPNAQVSRARFNLLVDNLGGIYFGGDPKVAARDTLVEHNVIARNSRFDVHSAYGANSPIGKRNLVQHNCIWSPGAVTVAGVGFGLRWNHRVDPRIVKVHGGYRLAASSPCRAYQPRR